MTQAGRARRAKKKKFGLGLLSSGQQGLIDTAEAQGPAPGLGGLRPGELVGAAARQRPDAKRAAEVLTGGGGTNLLALSEDDEDDEGGVLGLASRTLAGG